MHGRFLQILILSGTMASFFFPGLVNTNLTNPQQQPVAVSSEKPASAGRNEVYRTYFPLVDAQSLNVTPASQPVEVTTPENTPQPTPTPLPTEQPVSEKPAIKLAMEKDFHSQRWETSVKNACGPTALLMVLDYFGQAQPLPQVIKSFKVSPAKGGFDSSCTQNPVCLSAAVLEDTAQGTYKLGVVAHEDWTVEEVYQALENGQPVIADVTWRLELGGTGHFVVIYGLDPQKMIVYYHDPFDGASQTASWDQFSASWNGPVDTGDPLQPDGHHLWGMALAAK